MGRRRANAEVIVLVVFGPAHARGGNSTKRPPSRLDVWSPIKTGLAGRTSPATSQPNTNPSKKLKVDILDSTRRVVMGFATERAKGKASRDDAQKRLGESLFQDWTKGNNYGVPDSCLHIILSQSRRDGKPPLRPARSPFCESVCNGELFQQLGISHMALRKMSEEFAASVSPEAPESAEERLVESLARAYCYAAKADENPYRLLGAIATHHGPEVADMVRSAIVRIKRGVVKWPFHVGALIMARHWLDPNLPMALCSDKLVMRACNEVLVANGLDKFVSVEATREQREARICKFGRGQVALIQDGDVQVVSGEFKFENWKLGRTGRRS